MRQYTPTRGTSDARKDSRTDVTGEGGGDEMSRREKASGTRLALLGWPTLSCSVPTNVSLSLGDKKKLDTSTGILTLIRSKPLGQAYFQKSQKTRSYLGPAMREEHAVDVDGDEDNQGVSGCLAMPLECG